MSTLISIDPGESSGCAVIDWRPDAPPILIFAAQSSGGVSGFLGMLVELDPFLPHATIISEKFSPRPSGVSGFQQSLKSTLPLVCEGVMIGKGLMPVYTPDEPRYRSPALQYLVGGRSLADRKKRLHRFLKDSGFYRTGKDLGAPDADDFRSAAGHGLAFLAREVGNKPAYDLISTWIDRNPV